MHSQINTCGLMGIDSFAVQVQADISNGMSRFEIIGLPDTTVKESKERVRAAIRNSGYSFPYKHLTINLSPASLRKEGSSYDFPIAVSILAATGQLAVDDNETTMFIGEMSLDGRIIGVKGVLAMVISAYKAGFTKFFVPSQNAEEASIIKGAQIYPVSSLWDIGAHFAGEAVIEPHKYPADGFLKPAHKAALDMADVKGQDGVKRAIEIAAGGNHNILLVGAPGTGKSMMAQRITSILPDISFDEALEVTKVHSIAGMLTPDMPLITDRPFRSPHHTVSPAALSGGGTVPRPGELSLAHNGVLFLDELPEFSRAALETLRQPLEDGTITISRINATLTYPCNIMLVASMNPCKCGYFGSRIRECTCSRQQIQQYRNRISGPLMDRIDIQVEVAPVDFKDLNSRKPSEKSADIKKRVNAVRKIQLERYKNDGIYSNSQLTAGLIDKYCVTDEAADRILKAAFDNLGLSARAHSRILKVARTIADLEGSEIIKANHIAEAVQYRSLDRKYFQ